MMERVPIPRVPSGVVVPNGAAAVLERHAPLTVVRAPSGSGKSAVVARWAHDGAAAGSVVWLSAHDGDPLTQLADAVSVSGGGRASLVRELTERGEVTVVVDDLHEADRGVDDGLLDLVARAPRLHLVVLTRERRPIEVRGLVVADAAVVTARDLALDGAAIRTLFATRGLELTDDEVGRVLAETQGNLVAVRAALAHARGGPDGLVIDWAAVAEYAVDQLGKLAPRLRSALDLLVSAEALDPETAAAALGVGRAQAEDVVADLVGAGVLEPAGPGRAARVPAVLVRVVRGARDATDPAVLTGHRRLADLARRRRLPDIAVTHALDARAWDLAVAVIDESLIPFLLNHAPLLERVVREVPPQAFAPYPLAVAAIRVLQGQESVGDPRALGDDPRVRVLAAVRDLARLRFAGRLEESAQIARALGGMLQPAATPGSSNADAAVIRVQMAVSLFLVGDLDGAVRECDLVLGVTDGYALTLHSALGTKAVAAALRGRAREARAHLERAAAVPVGSGGMWHRAMVWERCARGLVGLLELDLETAREALESLDDVAPDEEAWAVIAFLRAHVAVFDDPHRGLGRLRETAAAETARRPSGSLAAELLGSVEVNLLHACREGTRAARRMRARREGRAIGQTASQLARVALALGLDEEARRRAVERGGDLAAVPWARVISRTVEAIAAHRLGRGEEAAKALSDAVVTAGSAGVVMPFALVPWEELSAIADQAGDLAARDLLDSPRVSALRDTLPARLEQIELTDREAVVLRALLDEPSQEGIASSLFVSTNTVKSQLRAVYRKLGATSRDEALTTARRVGLLDG